MENVDFLNLEQIYYWIYLIIMNIFYLLNPVRWINWYYTNWSFLMFCSLIFSFLLLIGIIYIYSKMKEVARENSEIFDTVVSSASSFATPESKNERWDKIIDYVNSESQAEWRLAILDADVILDKMLTRSGYHGEGVGEKLKGIERSDFLTLDKAWEAHKIRNGIAHGGSDLILTKRTAKKAIDLYRQVFEEFEYI